MIHAFQEADGWYIWLDPEDGIQRTGLCIGAGTSLAAAKGDAIQSLGEALKQVSGLQASTTKATEGRQV